MLLEDEPENVGSAPFRRWVQDAQLVERVPVANSSRRHCIRGREPSPRANASWTDGRGQKSRSRKGQEAAAPTPSYYLALRSESSSHHALVGETSWQDGLATAM